VKFQEILTSQFAWGFYAGCIFLVIAAYNYLRLKGEFSRYRRHLSDKLEIEAEAAKKTKAELETLRKENESLRVKVNALNEMPDRKLQRDLEIYARAEKRMLLNVPGFAPAWETAKNDSHSELSEEEAGKAAPKRIFARLFGGGNSSQAALPGRDNGSHASESESVKSGSGN
jgi:cell division protein FtsB